MEHKDIVKRVAVLNGQEELNTDELKELKELTSKLDEHAAKAASAKALEAAAAEEEAQRKAETAAAIEEAVKAEREAQEAKERRLPDGSAPYATKYHDEWKYDGLDASDLSLLIETQSNMFATGKANEVRPQPAAFKALSRRIAKMDENKATTEEEAKGIDYVKGAFKRGTKTNIDPTVEAVDAAIKAATDPMYSGGSLIGSDWVGTAYSNQIWEQIRADNNVAKNIPADVIPDGYSNKTWPLESTDMTWYKVAEASASDATLLVPAATVTASQMATASKNITVGKLGSRVLYTGELTEDSLIRFVPQLRQQLAVSGAEILEHVIIDGDVETSASKNINDNDTTPTASDPFLLFDGFRKLPLVTNTGNSLSASGALAVEDFLKLLQLMGTAGIAGADPTKVAFIVDGNTYYKLPQLPELKTRDTFNPAALENGFVQSMYNVPIVASFQMHRQSATRKATTTGYIDADTAANNTTGAVVAVRWDQWKAAYKRRMTMETTRIANADSWEIVALMRYGLAYRDTEASAILYNVGV